MSRITKRNAGWVIAVSILGALLAVFVVLYAISSNQNQNASASLENIYEKNFYDLVDNVNNTENKLAKAINATDEGMQAKYLREVSINAMLATTNLNNLPAGTNEMAESVAFVNQLSGYTETLSKNLEKGKSLSAQDAQTLEQVYDSVLYMKNILAEMNQDMWKGYNIMQASQKLQGETDAFTSALSKVKNVEVDYPTMIYDGPFSDSVVNKKVHGLSAAAVSEGKAKENMLKIFANLAEEDVELQGDASGRFETFNFVAKDKNGKETLFVQMTKQGGKLLTATSRVDHADETITMENAREIALNFCTRAGIDNPKVVWSDNLEGNAYINIAPVQENYVLYPDLVKVKIDLATGDVLGFEATGYYTNHTTRTLPTASLSKSEVQKFIPKKYVIKNVRLALIPLEYNREVATWEVACTMGGDEYYFYYNAQTGMEENILKVIKTNNGNLLM